MLLTGVLALLNLGSLRHTDLGNWPHFPLKQHQDRRADLSSLLLPLYSWRHIAPEQYFTAPGLGTLSTTMRFSVSALGIPQSSTKVQMICCQSFVDKQTQEKPLTIQEWGKHLNRKRDLCPPMNDVAKLQTYSLNCIKCWTAFFNNKEKATEVFSGKCKYLSGMSALWHEDRTPELPLLTTSEPQYLR